MVNLWNPISRKAIIRNHGGHWKQGGKIDEATAAVAGALHSGELSQDCPIFFMDGLVK